MPAEKSTMAAPQPAEATRKSATNWMALAKAGVKPVTVRCQTYPPIFRSDASGHSALQVNSATLKRHREGEHGGAYYVQLTPKAGKASTFWQDMEDSGLEAQDFRCEICDKVLRLPLHQSNFVPSAVCMRPHAGKTRRVYPGGKFNFYVSMSKPEGSEDELDAA